MSVSKLQNTENTDIMRKILTVNDMKKIARRKVFVCSLTIVKAVVGQKVQRESTRAISVEPLSNKNFADMI